MKHSHKLLPLRAAILVGVLATQAAHAGGISLYEIATPDVGLASAGYASRADDASTLFKNPAGMSRLQGVQFQGGLQALYGSVSFSPDANTSPGLGTDNRGNAVGWLPGGSLFVVVPLGGQWRAGLGAFSYFGLAEDYNDNWVGRYYVQESAIVGMTLMPSVSFEATDWLSIGAELNAMYGFLDTEMAVNRRHLLLQDAQMSLKDRTWGFGANVGVLIKASEKTRFGVTYLSAVDLDFSDTPTITGPNASAILRRELDLAMSVDQQSTVPVALGGRGSVSGSYDDAWFSIASLNLTWRF